MRNKNYAVLDTRASQSLSLECIRNNLSRHIQVARKKLGLKINDHIDLIISSEDEYIRGAADIHRDYLMSNCLINNLDIKEGKDELLIDNSSFQFNPDDFHTTVSIVNNDLHYTKDSDYGVYPIYKHYWDACYAWAEDK